MGRRLMIHADAQGGTVEPAPALRHSCALLVLTALWALVLPTLAPAMAMTASRVTGADGSTALLLEGEIEQGDAAKLIPVLQSAGVSEIWLNSRGGKVEESIPIGQAVRDLKMVTRVPGNSVCASACVDILVGGVIRFVDPGGDVIIHPGSIAKKMTPLLVGQYRKALASGKDSKAVQKLVRDYLELLEQNATQDAAIWTRHLTLMGVSIDLVKYAAKVRHSCPILLTRPQLIYLNIINTAGAPPQNYVLPEPVAECSEES